MDYSSLGVNAAAFSQNKSAASTKSQASNSLTMDDFYTLLAVQLQNQDMDNPMDNSEMMNQMVQMAMVNAMSTMTDQSVTSYATSMMGKKVEVLFYTKDGPQMADGTVTGVNLSVNPPQIYLDKKNVGYELSSVMLVGEVEVPEDAGKPEGPGEGGGAGESAGPGEGSGAGGSAGPGEGSGAGGSASPGEGSGTDAPDKTE